MERALLRQTETARQILRKLVVGRFVMTPDEARRTYTLTGQASYGRLIAGLVGAIALVPPERFAAVRTHKFQGLTRAA